VRYPDPAPTLSTHARLGGFGPGRLLMLGHHVPVLGLLVLGLVLPVLGFGLIELLLLPCCLVGVHGVAAKCAA